MALSHIIKRDGRTVPFDAERIAHAIFRAAKSVGGTNRALSEQLAADVVDYLDARFSDAHPPTVEDVQNAVEKILIETGHAQTSKAYILYRKQHQDLRDIRALLDAHDLVENYLDQSDWRVRENANMSYSLQGLNFHISSSVISGYWLNKIYPPQIATAHKEGRFHVHDLGILGAYCVGWDLKDLLYNGFGHVPGKVASKPARHFRTALGQIVNFFYTLQGEAAGAQAFSNFDSYLAPFIRYDQLGYDQVKQALQEFVFNINVPTRVGFQTPFTNVTMDLKVPSLMQSEPVIHGGRVMDETYGDFQPEMDLFNSAFCDVMMDGDANGRVFTFPIPTYNLTRDFDWDAPVSDKLFQMTAKYGVPYFSNFINSDMSPEDARSMCLDAEESVLYRKNGIIRQASIKDFVETNGMEFDKEGWSNPCESVEVPSLNPKSLKMEWKKVKRFLRVKKNKAVTIETRDGKKFKASENHLVTVLTPQGLKEKLAKDVQTGDYLLSLKDGSSLLNSQMQMMQAAPLDEALAFLLGFFTADGNFLWDNRNGRKLRGIQFSIGTKDEELIERIRTQIRTVWNTTAKVKKDPRYNTVYLYVYRGQIAQSMWQAGFKKHGKLPEVLLNSPKSVITSFLDGFFQGDGYDKRNEIHINDLELAEDLTRLYGMVGIPTIFKKKKNSQRIYLQNRHADINVTGLVNAPCLFECVPGFMAKSTYLVPGLNKGRMVSTAALQKYSAHTTESLHLASSDIYPVRVTSVSFQDSEDSMEFYDVELDENHLFLHSLGIITHNCCRLRLDNRELRKRGGGLFGANPLTGSVGVVTLNLPRLGYLSKTENAYFDGLDALMDLARDSLEIKRAVLERFTEKGLYPYSKYYLRDIKTAFGAYWKNHFATIGLIGLNESCLNFLGVNIADPTGKAFAEKVLSHMRDRLGQYQQDTGNIYNLEATPGEGTAYRLARIDRKAFSKIQVAHEKSGAPFYTNSSHLPVNQTTDIFDALAHQDDLQTKYTGGTVLHGFIGERITDWKAARSLVRKIAENFRLPYFTLTPTFSVCPTHGYLDGEHEYCPRCDAEIGYVPIPLKSSNSETKR